MAFLYSVIALAGDKAALGKAITGTLTEGDYFALAGGAGWLVSFQGTTQELSDKLTITGQAPGVKSEIGSVLLTSIGTYYGRGPADMWEWLKTRMEAST